jgi:crotonobetainyl-CoA:carnitine CoA-transferase CaiB-like acyl-CoA transferase
VQNWPPGVAARLDLDWETVRDLKPDLIYGHITGYGETGPSPGIRVWTRSPNTSPASRRY